METLVHNQRMCYIMGVNKTSKGDTETFNLVAPPTILRSTEATNILTWDGLNGEDVTRYKLIIDMVQLYSGGTSYCGLRFNNDSTSGHYGYQRTRSGFVGGTPVLNMDTDPSGTTLAGVGLTDESQHTRIKGEMYIWPQKINDYGLSQDRQYMGDLNQRSLNANLKTWINGYWTDTTNEITSISLVTNTTLY